MMVKVWNDNEYTYTEKFKGQTLTIEPKKFISMDENEAHQFLGKMPANILVDANGRQKPESYKRLRIDKSLATETAIAKFICNQDGKEFPNQEALDAHIEANYVEKILDEDSKRAFVEKRGRGRPKGSVNDTGSNRNGGAA